MFIGRWVRLPNAGDAYAFSCRSWKREAGKDGGRSREIDLATESDVINVTEEGYTRKLRRITYGALILPLRDPAGESLGLLVVAKDFSASRAASGRSLVWQSLLALFAIMTLAVAIIVVIRGFVLRPVQMMNDRFRSLAGGDRSKPIDQPETLCQEMQELAESYERLRRSDEERK